MKTNFHVLKYLRWVAVIALLAGCASHKPEGPQFSQPQTPPANKSSIYFYRPGGEKFGYKRTYALVVNGEKVADLKHGGYFPYVLEPGKVRVIAGLNENILTRDKLSPNPDAATLDFEAQAGRVYFVKFHPEVKPAFFVPRLFLVSSSAGASEIKSCRLIQNGNN